MRLAGDFHNAGHTHFNPRRSLAIGAFAIAFGVVAYAGFADLFKDTKAQPETVEVALEIPAPILP